MENISKTYSSFPVPKDAWDLLSLPEKSEMMKVAIKNGITNLQDIRDSYNEFSRGGYIPSKAIKDRISFYEGKAMTGAKDPITGKWGKNNSFENEAAKFYSVLPESIREQVLSNQDLADNLYSYSYNVGAGNFRKRVVPALERYYSGEGSIRDVENSMWASNDSKLRGLQRRRAEEKEGVRNALLGNMGVVPSTNQEPFEFIPSNPQAFFNPYLYQQADIIPEPPVYKEEEVSPYSKEELEKQDRKQRLNALSMVLGMSNPYPAENNSMLNAIGLLTGSSYAKGGKIYIKPKNRRKFTRLKERTGHSATWFKAHGTPAQKKMATFALNARKWKHGDGGPLSNEQYYSIMERVAEENNPIWNQQRAEEGRSPLTIDEEYLRILNDNSYDYRGYYNKYPQSRANADTHWTDEFKTVYHPTFSNQSIYSGKKSQFNPEGLPGGMWVGETFLPKAWQVAEANKYANGGHIYDGTSEDTQQMNNGKVLVTSSYGDNYYIDPRQVNSTEWNLTTPEVSVTANPDDVARGRAQRWYRDFGTESNDATSVAGGRRQNSHLDEWGIEGAAKAAAWAKEHPVLNNVGLGLSTIPLAVAATPAVVGGGELAATALANPYVDAALTSMGGAHAAQSLANGEANWMTALELAPLGRLAKPLYEGVVQPGMRLFNSPVTGNWTKIGNREYRLSPNSLGANGSPIESRGIAPQITAENAASITPEQWTAAQDAAIARGDMAETQRLRNLHSTITPTATPGKYYRGTKTKRTSYLDRHIDEEVGEMNGIYLTKKPKYAKTYGDVEEFYLHSNNPLETEGNWTGVIDDATRAKIENAGYDVIVNNRFDTGFLNRLLRNSRDETITFDGRNIKSADAVTYDPVTGERIPLGERDNFSKNDVLWGLLPFLGLGTAGTLYEKQE